MTQSHTFVLVHGAWCGGWIWREVADRMRAKGHRVLTPTLTGLADRSHLLSKDTDLSTHITDIVNLIKWEELTNIVLVGHSYGGLVISGVAEEVPAGTISSIVYVDAIYLEEGETVWGPEGPPLPAVSLPGGIQAISPPPLSVFGIEGPAAQDIERLLTPMPLTALAGKPRSTKAAARIPNKTFLAVTKFTLPFLLEIAEKRKADPAWRVETLDCGHCTMVDMPRETAEVLMRAAE